MTAPSSASHAVARAPTGVANSTGTSGDYGPLALIAGAVRRERALVITTFAILALALPTIVALTVETRTLAGLNVWIKPLKFDASVALLLATYAIGFGLARADDRRRLWVRGAVGLVIVSAVLEIAYISFQAARGEASHFNLSSRWEIVAFQLMGMFAVILTAGAAVAAVLVWRAGPGRLGNGLWLGLVLGFGLTFVLGIVTGFAIGGNGGHFVAAAGAMPGNDLGGIPVFGWSREVGDLRAAHFVGLHVMQILPLVGWAADRLAPRASPWAVLVMALALTGLTVWALVVALSGQSVVPAGW
ncbi:hypothetical protein RUR49_05140 [Pseudoxanthobacter sp. M-2]|uniref:hypothetical protein n=1 Tax=Pseudoxanthobacter sp. M-2 TaxID=3078754 RepID=UPI0038FC4A43